MTQQDWEDIAADFIRDFLAGAPPKLPSAAAITIAASRASQLVTSQGGSHTPLQPYAPDGSQRADDQGTLPTPLPEDRAEVHDRLYPHFLDQYLERAVEVVQSVICGVA